MGERHIKSIRISGLFGLYSYVLPQQGEFSNASILYGDNGVGKSTILRLVFHLLSPANKSGHRGALYKADFENLEVLLSSDVIVSASKISEDEEIFLALQISRGSKILATWRFKPGPSHASYWETLIEIKSGRPRHYRKHKRNQPGETQVPEGENAFLSALAQHAPVMFILNADRRLDSDAVPDPSDEVELRRALRMDEPKRINDLVVRSREIALSQALAAAQKWIYRRAIQASNQGAMNVHGVYANILRHLQSSKNVGGGPTDIIGLQKRLTVIENRTSELARYELQSPLSMAEFRRALSGRAKAKVSLAADLLEPYVESIEARVEALDPIYRLVDRFVTIVNGLLSDKTLRFQLSQGFSIWNKLDSKLEAGQLSSGEQQLLLLFSYVLTGRDSPSVFMIDEPEISLNIKWQRQLIQALLDITEGTTVQFIFASHSLELLAQHRQRVVKLTSVQ
ncbi:MAG: ATP-binding protein [Methylocystis sp.]